MPDRYDNANFIDKAYEVAAQTQKKIGEMAPDEVSFVLGFIACFGIITGRVDIGLAPDTPLMSIFDIIHKDIVDFGRRVATNQQLQNEVRDRLNGFKH
jgi:hypothetical protein